MMKSCGYTTTVMPKEEPDSRSSSIDYQGSDDDIRSKFEQYIISLLVSYKAAQEVQVDASPKKDYLSPFHTSFIKQWEQTRNFKIWNQECRGPWQREPGHPFHGTTVFSVVSSSISAKISEFRQNMSPLHQTSLKTGDAVETTSVSNTNIKPQSTATTLFNNLSSW